MSEIPDQTWLTLDQAPFYYLPGFTGRGPAWGEAIASILLRYRLGPPAWDIKVDPEEEQIDVIAGNVRLSVSAINQAVVGLQSKAHDDPDWGWRDIRRDQAEVIGSLTHVRLMLADEPMIQPDLRGDVRHIIKVIDLLGLQFDQLSEALGSGGCKIVARSNSPTAPFEEIQQDQWRYFSASTSLDDAAVGPSGEVLYSIYVVPKASQSIAQSSASSEKRCEEWLREQMILSLGKAPQPRENYLIEARRRWPGLSDRAFGRAWKNAIERSGAKAWAKGGRPRKNPAFELVAPI